MNFVILTDYFQPIIKSGSIIIGDLSEELINQGHKVSIVTFVNVQDEECKVSLDNNLQIIRIRCRSRSYGMLGRLWAEQRYSKKIIKNLIKLNFFSYDAIICYSPSIFYGPAIKWLKTRNNVKAYLVIRDIFPKWALDSNLIRKGVFYYYLKTIEKKLYSNSDIIGIEAKSDLDYFINYQSEKSFKVEVLSNWGSEQEIKNVNFPHTFLDDTMVNIVYGGNISSAQNLLSLIDMIDHTILEERAFLTIMGSGNQFDAIKEIIRRKKLKNIILMPLVEKDQYISIMSNADIGLVSLGSQMRSNNYPLKMIGYMQLGKPILASVNKNNEIFNLINENKIGFVSEASNQKEFNNNLNLLITNNDNIRRKQGQNGIKLFNDKYTAKVATSQICSHFI
jgi:glycosyltransferase involved in cell wall biosynthesis